MSKTKEILKKDYIMHFQAISMTGRKANMLYVWMNYLYIGQDNWAVIFSEVHSFNLN